MGLVSEQLKICGIKIVPTIKGVDGAGSGVLYLTPNTSNYNYVLTAKHVLQEDSLTPFSAHDIEEIKLYYNERGDLRPLEIISKRNLNNCLITFEEDFAIIIVNKNNSIPFKQILVSDELRNKDNNFIFWSIFKANENELQKFEIKRNDPERRRYRLNGNHLPEYLQGMSGAGVFLEGHNILYGVISRYPNQAFQNEAIDCSQISFADINSKLSELNRVLLDTRFSPWKREVNNEVVDIHQVYINNVCLDLEQARKRLAVDISDDWYHDPLKYKDLLQQDYIFDEFAPYFSQNKYKPCPAEIFYVPKKKFTLRLALVSPFMDRIIYIACVGVLAESLDDAMIPNAFSARYNRYSDSNLILNGVEQWKKMRYKLAELGNIKEETGIYKFGCIIEIDLLNFYDNISKKLLHEKILRVCKNENEKNAALLLYNILLNISSKDLGLPQNGDASSLLASFYLNQVDIFMHYHVSEYFRFMDDVRIFCKDKFEARKHLQIFEYELRRCYLSVNSQKTEIFTLRENKGKEEESEKFRLRSEFSNVFDLLINKISRLRKSTSALLLNEAFHDSIKLLKAKMAEAEDSNEDSAKKINFAFNAIASLAVRGINLKDESGEFYKLLLRCVQDLKNKPWFTAEVCKVLNLIPKTDFNSYLPYLTEVVLIDKYNTYAFQNYHIWLLLAKRKCNQPELTRFAITQIERNDDTNIPVIAAMLIYMCSIDPGYRRIVIRKFGEKFTHGYFQGRLAMISVRSFEPNSFRAKEIHPTLVKAHKYTNKYAEKDLVYIPGFDEDDTIDNEEFTEQMFSF